MWVNACEWFVSIRNRSVSIELQVGNIRVHQLSVVHNGTRSNWRMSCIWPIFDLFALAICHLEKCFLCAFCCESLNRRYSWDWAVFVHLIDVWTKSTSYNRSRNVVVLWLFFSLHYILSVQTVFAFLLFSQSVHCLHSWCIEIWIIAAYARSRLLFMHILHCHVHAIAFQQLDWCAAWTS